jgi:hypothetical protein
MNAEVKSALITAAAIGVTIIVTVPIALTVYDKGLKPMLDKKATKA